MKKEKVTLDFNTVHECNRCLDCKTLHPQVSLINLENPSLEQYAVKFEFYAILLIEQCPDEFPAADGDTTITPMRRWYSSLPVKSFV